MRSLLFLCCFCGAIVGLGKSLMAASPVAIVAAETESNAAGESTPEEASSFGKPGWLLIGYSAIIILSSMTGGWLPTLLKLTHKRMQMLMSLVGGLMLGIGLFHLLPHGLHELGPNQLDRGIWWMVVGVVTMFLLIRMFHFHAHDVPDAAAHDHDCDEAHDHDHGHAHAHGHSHGTGDAHELSWLGVFLGLSLHTLIDGLALGASIQADAAHGTGGLFGLGTFLAIALHKPLDAISITTLMKAGGWSRGWMTLVNIAFSTMCPLGAAIFVFGLSSVGDQQSLIIGCALTFSAGVFLCISLGDLLPEMEFHSHNRVQLTFLLLLGLAMAYGIRYLEPEHAHGGATEARQDEHDHDGHDHSTHHGHNH